MQDTPKKASRNTFIVAVFAVALGFIAATGVALHTRAPSWEAAFNAEIANAVTVDTTGAGRKLAFSFDLAWQPTYSSLICWGREGDARLTQPSWNTFRQEMNRHKAETIGLAMKPWSDGTVAALLTVRLSSSDTATAQEDARETIELLRRRSPCVR